MKRAIVKANKINIKPQNFIFIYLITATIVVSLTVSKYITKINAKNVVKVAVMANSTSINLDLADSGVYPGFETVYTISLSNVEDGKVCEVDQKFLINLEKDEFENIPLNYALYKNESCTEIIEPDENGKYSLEEFVFKGGVEEEKEYFLKINWPKEKNDAKYAFEVGYCIINVISTQIN